MRARIARALVDWLGNAGARLLHDRVVVASADTMFGPTQVVDVHDASGAPVRVLEVDGTWQSATYLDDSWCELVFPYHRLFARAMGAMGRRPQRVLMLGGGGYAFPKYLVAHDPDARADVVEVDPAVSRLARDYFLLGRLDQMSPGSSSRIRTFNTDGRAFLDGDAGLPRYDVVANDCFGALLPTRSLATLEGARAARGRLARDGIYVANVVSALEGERSRLLRDVTRTLGEVFSHVYVIPCSTDEPDVEDNNVVVASDAPLELEGVLEPSPEPAGAVLRD